MKLQNLYRLMLLYTIHLLAIQECSEPEVASGPLLIIHTDEWTYLPLIYVILF